MKYDDDDQVLYNGELFQKVYQSGEQSFYTVHVRRRALHGKWYVFAGGIDVLACCEYRCGAIRICDELNALHFMAYNNK